MHFILAGSGLRRLLLRKINKMVNTQSKIRVGQIAYTNCIPFYHGLTDFEFTKAVPTDINRLMHEGKMDVAPISSLEYLSHADNYFLLPDIAIGARDFAGSVILISRQKIETLNHATIALTSESYSSVALLKILLKLKYKFENDFIVESGSPDQMIEKYPAALAIGDSALFYHPKEFVYKYDLAELWWNWTGKPFCFAVWAVLRSFAESFPEEVGTFYRRLKNNLEKNLSDIESLVKNSLNLQFLDDKFPKIFGYLFNLQYGLDQEMQRGLELFYQLAHQIGVAPQPHPINFFISKEKSS